VAAATGKREVCASHPLAHARVAFDSQHRLNSSTAWWVMRLAGGSENYTKDMALPKEKANF